MNRALFHRALTVAAAAALAATAALALPSPAQAADPTADGAVTLTAAPQFGLLDPSLVYTVTVTNHGPDPLAGAQVTVAVSDVLTPASGGTCTVNPGSAVCPVATLAPGASQTQTVVLPVNPVTLALTVRATATLGAAVSVDPDPANNAETVDCTYLTALLVRCS